MRKVFITSLVLFFLSPLSAFSQTVYTVQSGDTLSIIARRFYGDGMKWDVIYNANTDRLKNHNAIYEGLKLTIPSLKTNESPSSSPDRKKNKDAFPVVAMPNKNAGPLEISGRMESRSELIEDANAFGHQWKITCERDYPPYNFIDESGALTGLDTEIVTEVLKFLDVDFIINTFPWKRVVQSVDANEVDFAYQFASLTERFEKYWMVGPIRSGITLFVVKRNSPITGYNSLRDLIPYSIGHVMGYAYSDEFDSASYLTKEGIRDNELLIQILAKGRCEMIVGDFNTLSFFAKKNRLYEEIRFLPKILKEVPRYVAFPKEKKAQAILFAKGLKSIENSSEYDRILKKWQ